MSAWIMREWKPLLEALGGPSELLRSSIQKRAKVEAALLKEKAECRKLRKELDERERSTDLALDALEKIKENGNSNGNNDPGNNEKGKRRKYRKYKKH